LDPDVEKPLNDLSILLVEDDIILSTDLSVLLTEAGCKAVVPAPSNAAALSAMVHYIFDAAILDVNIQNEWVFPVATALQTAGIPFLFLTAYSRESIPAEHRERLFIQKPHGREQLLDGLVRLLTPADAPPIPIAANDQAPAVAGAKR